MPEIGSIRVQKVQMLKLILCLTATMATAICLVQLRQQRLELNHQTSQLHNAIAARQGRLWNQQLQIANVTAPMALQASIGKNDLKLTPLAPIGHRIQYLDRWPTIRVVSRFTEKHRSRLRRRGARSG